MKTDYEIMDDFVDDWLCGYIEWDPYKKRTHFDEDFRKEIVDRAQAFVNEIWNYRKCSTKSEKETLANTLLHKLSGLRIYGLFPFTQDTVKLLKIEIENLKRDNKELAQELEWYRNEYGPRTQTQGAVKV